MQTVTTVGYGDSVPITLGGKLVASLCMIVAMIIVPLPIAIFSASLTELYFESRAKRRAARKAQYIFDNSFKKSNVVPPRSRSLEEDDFTQASSATNSSEKQDSADFGSMKSGDNVPSNFSALKSLDKNYYSQPSVGNQLSLEQQPSFGTTISSSTQHTRTDDASSKFSSAVTQDMTSISHLLDLIKQYQSKFTDETEFMQRKLNTLLEQQKHVEHWVNQAHSHLNHATSNIQHAHKQRTMPALHHGAPLSAHRSNSDDTELRQSSQQGLDTDSQVSARKYHFLPFRNRALSTSVDPSESEALQEANNLITPDDLNEARNAATVSSSTPTKEITAMEKKPRRPNILQTLFVKDPPSNTHSSRQDQ